MEQIETEGNGNREMRGISDASKLELVVMHEANIASDQGYSTIVE